MQELVFENLISILFMVVLVFSFISGFTKGFIKMVISFGSLIVSVILTRIFTPVVVETIKNITNIESTLTTMIYNAIVKTNLYDSVNLPFMKNAIDTGNIQGAIRDNLCNGVANAIISLCCGIVVFIVLFIAMKLIIKVLDVVNYIPLVGQFNKILGGLFGVLEMMFVFWIIFAVLRVFESMPQVKVLTDNIKSSFVVGPFYQSNIVYNFFANLFSASGQVTQ